MALPSLKEDGDIASVLACLGADPKSEHCLDIGFDVRCPRNAAN